MRRINLFLDRVANLFPRSVRSHPVGVGGMWLWSVWGASLLVPSSDGDPKRWPDLMWPADLLPSDHSETVAVALLGLGMFLSGVMFVVAQFNLQCRWAPFARYLALWVAAMVGLYVSFGIVWRVVFNPDAILVFWPISVLSWLACSVFFLLGARRALEPGAYGYEPNGGEVRYGRRWND